MHPESTIADEIRPAPSRALAVLKPSLFFILAAVLMAGIFSHVDGLNGPSYWRWPWRRLDGAVLYPPMLAALLPLLAAQWLFERRGGRVALPLFLVALGTLALELVGAAVQSDGHVLQRVAGIVQSPWATSYFTAASSVGELRGWLGDFAQVQGSFPLHANNKPPGPVLYYAAILRLFAGQTAMAATVGGLLVGIGAAFSGPATYWMGRSLKLERAEAFHAACLVSLAPGLVLFFPEFDQVWPVLGCAMVALWSLALERCRLGFALAFGAVTAVAAFFTWNLLTLGAALALHTLWCLLRREERATPRLVARQAAATFAVLGSSYLALWLATGYEPVGVFLASHERVSKMLGGFGRSYPATIPWDIEDALFGFGWLGMLLLAFNLARTTRERSGRLLWLTVLPLLQLAIIAAGGFFRGETARVAMFLFPLLALPAGMELARWRLGARVAALATCGLLVAVVCQHMGFVGP